jgi:hypothetical protein
MKTELYFEKHLRRNEKQIIENKQSPPPSSRTRLAVPPVVVAVKHAHASVVMAPDTRLKNFERHMVFFPRLAAGAGLGSRERLQIVILSAAKHLLDT